MWDYNLRFGISDLKSCQNVSVNVLRVQTQILKSTETFKVWPLFSSVANYCYYYWYVFILILINIDICSFWYSLLLILVNFYLIPPIPGSVSSVWVTWWPVSTSCWWVENCCWNQSNPSWFTGTVWLATMCSSSRWRIFCRYV